MSEDFEEGDMPAANAVKRRVNEKHRLKKQKEKAKKRGLDTSNPFWRLLLNPTNAEIGELSGRPGRGR
jgi:hypothetical protein